jgi:tRNA pseudouridine32 synthase/23S rRNA pseudouridine746 synthase
MKPDPEGLKAVSNFTVLGRGGRHELAGARAGDGSHASAPRALGMARQVFRSSATISTAMGPRFGEPTLHLHAREIVIPISRNKDPIRVVAPAPPHLHERLRACGWNGE